MTLTRNVLKRYLLLLCLSAVLRPTAPHWTPHNQSATEDRQSDGAHGTCSYQGPSIPVALLLTHFGCRDVTGKRKMRRSSSKRTRINIHQPAFHLALPHQLITKTTPCALVLTYFLNGIEVGVPKISLSMIVEGAGAYLQLIYLLTIEKNPGPMTEDERDAALTNILGAVQAIKTDLETVKRTCDTVKVELQDMKQTYDKRFASTEKVVNELKVINNTTQQRLNELESYIRRKNIIIFGVPASVTVPEALKTVLQDSLGLPQVPLHESAYRLGKLSTKPPIIVKLNNHSDKQAIMSNAKKLKGTKIVVSDDLTPEEQAARRTIVSAAKTANSMNIPCRVRRSGLLVSGQLLKPVELCNPDWMNNFVQTTDSQGRPPSNSQGAGAINKRPHSSTVSPASAAAAALVDFRRPRSDSTGSNSGTAGGRPKRTQSKEDPNRNKSKTNK